MRNYGKFSILELVIKGLIALVIIFVVIQVFRAVFAIVAALLTLVIIALGIMILLRLLGGRRRF